LPIANLQIRCNLCRGENHTMIFRLLILAVFLALPIVDTAAPAADSLDSTSSFYSIRRDRRRCASPMCGGYFIKLVNRSLTRCANGRSMAECYVASIEWNGQPEADKDGALVRGRLDTRGNRNGKYGVLHAREVWLTAGNNQPLGSYYRVVDRGIRCIAAPCKTHHEARLNTTVNSNIAGVELAGAGAPEDVVGEATAAMTHPDGVLVAGLHAQVSGPAGRAQMLKASQFYVRAKAGDTSSGEPGGTSPGRPGGTSPGKPGGVSPGDNADKPCFRTGCSAQICADEDVVTTCEYRSEYACYRGARCERQANGKCGFTDTPELRRCLKGN